MFRGNEQVTGFDPMHRVIDTGMEFCPPPNIPLGAPEHLANIQDIVADVDPAAFRSLLQASVAVERPEL